ncbi:serine acetyltransferase [Parafannyhessea umbonata]|uniref:serine acetyltransferase n=2 Tax=Atopobiaceae TaxID=1643824 RepID=UPI0015D66F06
MWTVSLVNEYVKSDLYRYTGKTDWVSFIRAYKGRCFRWQVAFRLSNGVGFERLLGNILWMISITKHSIQIPKETTIGYGLYIGHGGPIVCNATASIGNNCNLSQWTTIGSNENHAATIGDNVYIGPNCCIVEDVTIGSNVTIGAGSVVTKDIPSNATVAGNYAKVLNYNNPGRYCKNRWIPLCNFD